MHNPSLPTQFDMIRPAKIPRNNIKRWDMQNISLLIGYGRRSEFRLPTDLLNQEIKRIKGTV